MCRPPRYQSIVFYCVPALGQVVVTPPKLPKYIIHSVPAPAQVGCVALEVTKVFPKSRYLQRSCPCPGGVCRPQCHQSIVIYSFPTPAQVGCVAFKVAKLLLLTVFPRLPRCFKVIKVLLFTVFPPLPRWGVPPSKSPKHVYLWCSCPCPGGVCRP